MVNSGDKKTLCPLLILRGTLSIIRGDFGERRFRVGWGILESSYLLLISLLSFYIILMGVGWGVGFEPTSFYGMVMCSMDD